MKRNLLKGVFCGLAVITLLSGCGSKGSSSYSDSSGNYSDKSFVNSSTVYTGAEDAGYFSTVKLSGSFTDYSYTYEANGSVDTKETVLDFYNSIEEYIADKNAYIENINNSFRMDDDNSNPSYSATGTLRFTVQVEEKEVENIVNLMNQYCEAHNFKVSVYNQTAKNYENFEIVESSDEVNAKDYLTQDQLKKILSYSDISVKISYHIDRPLHQKIGIGIKNIVLDILEQYDEIIYMILMILMISFTIVFVLIVGSGIFTKALYKRRLKHPEWYPAKEVKIVNRDGNAAVEKVEEIKTKEKKSEEKKES